MHKFVCDSNTEKECFIRRLFGNPEEVDIQKGDKLFLHNNDSDFLMGPFIAASDLKEDISPVAWDGDYQYQVRIDWEEPIYGLSISIATDPHMGETSEVLSNINIHGGFQSLSTNKGEDIISTLKNYEKSQKLVSQK